MKEGEHLKGIEAYLAGATESGVEAPLSLQVFLPLSRRHQRRYAHLEKEQKLKLCAGGKFYDNCNFSVTDQISFMRIA